MTVVLWNWWDQTLLFSEQLWQVGTSIYPSISRSSFALSIQ